MIDDTTIIEHTSTVQDKVPTDSIRGLASSIDVDCPTTGTSSKNVLKN